MMARNGPQQAVTKVTALLFPVVLLAQSAMPGVSHGSVAAKNEQDELLARIWRGVQHAQKEYATACGRITETRTSELLARPLVFRGTFCAEGMTTFNLQYDEPEQIRVRFNEDYLNVSTGPRGRSTEVFRIGHHVRGTQDYFSREQSIDNLEKNFVIAVREADEDYEMRLVPKTKRFRKRINHIVVKLRKDDFVLRSLEVDGKSGVNSVFTIQVTELNTKLSADIFRIYRP